MTAKTRVTQLDNKEPRQELFRLGHGRYSILRRLGSGGMGVVWEAYDETLERGVAIKQLTDPPLTADARDLFQQEAKAAAGLVHPNIVSVFDFGEDNGIPFIVMEFIDSPSLATLLRLENSFSAQRAAHIVSQVAAGLEAAHAAGIVHCDIKPANIAVDSADRAKIMDFGVAEELPQTKGRTRNTILGTPAYLAPERAAGSPPTPASDVYAAGAVLYEMLSGSPLFRGRSPEETIIAVRQSEPVPIKNLVPNVGEPLAAVCMESLSREESSRPSASQLSRRLADIAESATPTQTLKLPSASATTLALTPAQTTGESLTTGRMEKLRDWKPKLIATGAILCSILILFLLSSMWPVSSGQADSTSRSLKRPPSHAAQTPPVSKASIPDVSGTSLDQARTTLRTAGFTVNRVRLVPGAPGQVVSTRPGPGTQVSQGQAVTIRLGAGQSSLISASPAPAGGPASFNGNGKHLGWTKQGDD